MGWFFVPILHWWKPYSPLCELWSASKKPHRPHESEESTLVITWWALWALAPMSNRIANRFARKVTDLDSRILALNVLHASQVIALLLTLATLILVHRIHAMQMLAARRGPPSLPPSVDS